MISSLHKFDWGEDFWRELVSKQKPMLLRDQRLAMDWLIRGKFSVGVPTSFSAYRQAIDAGAPVFNILLEDVRYLSGDIAAVMDKAPHQTRQRY